MEVRKGQVCDIPGKVNSIAGCLRAVQDTVADVYIFTERMPHGRSSSTEEFLLLAAEARQIACPADRSQEEKQETGLDFDILKII